MTTTCGGVGDDTYYVDIYDQVIENNNEGFDTVLPMEMDRSRSKDYFRSLILERSSNGEEVTIEQTPQLLLPLHQSMEHRAMITL